MTNTRSQVKIRQPTEDETRRLLRLQNRNRVALHRQFRCWVETEEIAKSLAPEELGNIRLRMKEEKQVAYDRAKEATAGSRITLAVLTVQLITTLGNPQQKPVGWTMERSLHSKSRCGERKLN